MHFHPSRTTYHVGVAEKNSPILYCDILFFYKQFEITDKTVENVIHDFDIPIGKII